MLKKLLIIPTSLILLTSFKVNSYQTSSGYKRLSNISAQYSISDTCNYVAISDFSIYSYKIKKRESIRFYVSQMPAYKNVYIDIRLLIKKEILKAYMNIGIKNQMILLIVG